MKYLIAAVLLLPVNLFASTFVLFSNNSQQSFEITSKALNPQNLQMQKDYDTVIQAGSESFLPNLKTLRFNSNVNIKPGRTYEFEVLIKNLKYPEAPLKFVISTKGLLMSSQIVETKLILPDDSSIYLNPHLFQHVQIPSWNNQKFYFVPYFRKDNTVSWPSFVLTVDDEQKESFDYSAPNTFKSMNYNIQMFPFYGDVIANPNNKLERANRIPELIGNHYDYVSLNEVFDRELREKIVRRMATYYPYHTEPPGMDGLNILSGGVIAFSKWPILESKEYVYKSCNAEECLSNKGVSYLKIAKTVNGITQIYNIFATHVQAYPNTKIKKAYNQPRTKQIHELKEFIEAQNISITEPVFVTGDLNIDKYDTRENEYTAGIFQTEYQFLLKTLGAIDPNAAGLKYSFDSKLNSMTIEEDRSRLDYVLYLKKHKAPINSVNKIKTLRDTWNEKMYPNFDTSDHFPVIGEFTF